ncbi:SusC/RagA family TonB-linked outer membrane protein [Sinomicrobium weinanense]|uniref:TonB-dependent receptor n=1 Tax=Sinomicrobium weinanense TaxID=2842200 RepID=A0A926JR80_9FLAO|nr:TonB-dependent receptor [Sinomicrobium weinanense]MBC9795824.1 TonB-dependent receptor [Sinomicrobium weinanense]MBU3121868.1 TonB-dependent receptor [Sinomicrobium weinanense]
MKIKWNGIARFDGGKILVAAMKTFIFFYCAVAFSFSPFSGFSQNARIKIDTDKTLSVEQIFNLIESQTDYKFIYRHDVIKAAPPVRINKGVIRAGDLLHMGLDPIHYSYDFFDDTIIVKRKESIPVYRSSPQPIQIKGVVTGEDGVPVEGITVYVTNVEPSSKQVNREFIIRGTATDMEGNFSLQAEPGYFLVVTGIGYEFAYQEINADQTVYNIVIKEKVSALEEVLVVGYGTTKKKDLTGSVGSIDSKDIQQIKTQTVEQTLVGQIPGVHVSAQSGGPGSGAIVHIRGLSQLIGDNQPLYVVDGVPITVNPRFGGVGSIGVFGDRENPLLSINPTDIERVDILKDASAAAIYGSRAANGVVLITTKRGKRNHKPRLDFAYSTTIQNPVNTYDVLSTSQFHKFITDQGQDGEIDFGDANTDWQDEITNKNAIWNQYDLSVAGGSSKMNYLVSGRVTDQEGLMLGNKFTRYSFSSNIDADITDRLKTGVNISYNYTVNKRSGLTSLADGAFFRPDLPVFNEDGSYSTSPGPYGFTVRNPVGDNGKVKNKAVSQNLLGNIYGEYKIIDGLKFRSQLSLTLNNDRTSIFSPSFTLNALFGIFDGKEGALLDVQHNAGVSTSWANTLNFNKTLGKNHNIDAVAGVSWDHYRLDLESQGYAGFPDDEVLTDINSANDFVEASSDVSETALNSVFGRINYNYKDKYLATFTARYDGSIKFGPDNQWGFFPSGALAWNIHNEDFLKDSDFIDQIKLRASLGRTGSDNLPAFTYLSYYRSLDNNDSFYDGINGIAVEGVPNSGIRWEETDQLDLGLEFGLFNGRLNGEIVYFEKKTNDIILLVPIPAQTGSSHWNTNIADVTNKGWEFALGGDIIRSPQFRWNSSFNISFIKNNVDALHGGSTTAYGSTGILEGEPMGVIVGYEVETIAQTQEEIDILNSKAPDGNYYSSLVQPGDYIYKDVDGDGEITNDDRKPLGDINPDFFGGWNNNISYKNFDLVFNFNFVKGNDKEWQRGASQFVSVNPNNNVTTDVLDTWTPNNTGAKYARMGSATHGSFTPTSKSVEDASYIRLRSVSLAYNFPKTWLANTGISNIQLSVSGNNLLTITGYPGIDPESVNSQRGGATVDLIRDSGDFYPQMRSFTIGARLSL